MNSEMNNKNLTKVSIVIPVYNGEQSIGRLTDELVTALKGLFDLEIVLVNDNSPDNSEAVCEGLFKKYPDIVCFYSLAKNVGEHNAVMAGLNQATGDYMVIMDDDFQNPITEVVKLVNYATENDCDVTYTFYKKKKHSFFRNLGSRFNDKVANVMLKKPGNLYLSSFKALSRFIVDEITKYDLPYPYIDGLILRTTDKIAKVEVEHREREAGRSGYTFTKLVRLWLNMFTSFSILPLRVSAVMGMIFSLLGLGLGVFTVIEKLANPDLPIGYAATIVVISIFAGIQLLSLGMIGEYVGRIFMSFNKKPQYTIRKRFTTGGKDERTEDR
jgi:undecaprenyl-phosphate 4-deoxy-4-formamido-L-arabinose transferase